MGTSRTNPVQSDLFDPSISRDQLIRILRTLFHIEHIMSTISDLKLLLRLVLEEAMELVDGETGSVMLYDEQSRQLYFEVPLGPVGDKLQEIRISIDEGICGYACRTGESVNVHDTSKDPRFLKKVDDETEFQSNSIAAVPMFRKGKLIGVIEVINKKHGGVFSDDDIRILEVLAGQAGIAIENARLYQQSLEKERLAAIGQAVAGLGHFVKNLVTGMQGSSALVEQAIKEQKYDMLPKAWEILKRSTKRVSNLVQDMLTVSKDREPELADCLINDLLSEVCDVMQDRAAEQGVAIERCFGAPDEPVRVDPNGVIRSCLNLVGNAIDAIALDPARDYEKEGHIRVTTAFSDDQRLIVIRVEDNGCGIPKENIEKIFGAFWSTKGSAGTGLGLAVTGKIIREHGGVIRVDSEVGSGSSFTIELPIVRPAS